MVLLVRLWHHLLVRYEKVFLAQLLLRLKKIGANLIESKYIGLYKGGVRFLHIPFGKRISGLERTWNV